MSSFRKRIRASSSRSSIILANDLDGTNLELLEKHTLKNIKTLGKHLCAIKFNFHLLLPLGEKSIKRINKAAHDFGLQTIADIKLNDIGNTNMVTLQRLWYSEFDAVISNPIMGPENLLQLVKNAHNDSHGVITLVHMSHPGAKLGYGLRVQDPSSGKMSSIHDLFLKWSYLSHVDGIVVGATVPRLIELSAKKAKGKFEIYSPGIGTQGGDPNNALDAGANYLIVGRTILNSKNPQLEVQKLQDLTLRS
ncbi:MAG: orotidine 5'-phosphate decarboxylase [Thaumarchaeota archaeon]|nr:orotidine 5'-phosphate decarboxylase [Nitrososphaerota archaeon]MDE1832346.1 orotidine 5'-phosphate decarboxylase [Nitrososphaerota archaeon]MDE1840760.1 orotidine 5'-phosphate decarboxylase [Nitrososphaerota archaeon]MDE1878073.1 orotidine 5'-phosphate decarboxylase [Nitrososphaerota archaeon]